MANNYKINQTKLKDIKIIAVRYISLFRSYTTTMTEAQEEKRITTEYDFLHFNYFRNRVRNHGVLMFKIEVRKKIFQ